jgi:CubicO group peptidase (beta-lactamase class C family)
MTSLNRSPRRSLRALLAPLALALFTPVGHAADVPPGVVDPDVAIHDPQYSDPVFWWRLTSVPPNVYEPDPYFYWPAARIEGTATDAFLPEAPAGKTSIPKAALEAASTWAEAHKTYALIVVHRGRVQLERYYGPRGKPDELTNGRALTRSVTHMLLGFAVADGKMSLDDPLSKFLPEWRDDPRGAITVRQLAQNVSGLEVAPQLPVTRVAGNKDLCLAYCGDVVRAAMQYPLVTPPGTRFEFAQENFQLVGLVTERATGIPLQQLLQDRIWKKIGARDGALQLDRPGGTARVMCCMRATPRDWARLGMLVLDGGKWRGEQVLPKGWVETMATPSARNPSYGLGLWRGSPYVAKRLYFEGQPNSGGIANSEPFLADDVLMMEGGGNRVIWAVPSKQLMIMRLGEQVEGWDQSYLPNLLLRAMGKR